MVKNSVLLVLIFAMGLSLGSKAEAGKRKSDFGPMDLFVIRTSRSRKVEKVPPVVIKKKKKAGQLTPLQRAYLSKI